jgi:hypothetical protein
LIHIIMQLQFLPSWFLLNSTKERGNNCRKMDLQEDRVSHGFNSWKEGSINIFWADRHETPEGNRRNGKVSNLVRNWSTNDKNMKGPKYQGVELLLIPWKGTPLNGVTKRNAHD